MCEIYFVIIILGSGKQVAAGQTDYIGELREQHASLDIDDTDMIFE